MATSYTLTRNLRLRLDSNLTASARSNLEKIDLLGSTFLVDSANTLRIRSTSDIAIEPESPDLGGTAIGGTLRISSASQPLSGVVVNTSLLQVTSGISLLDQATGGSKYLVIQGKTDTTGPVDTISDRVLSVDLRGGSRSLVLQGSLSLAGGSLVLTVPSDSTLSLPSSGTLATLAGTETLTHKTIYAPDNDITGISNNNLGPSAGITYSNLDLAGSIVDSDVAPSAAIQYQKLNLTSSIVDADIGTGAAISRDKLAPDTPNAVLINSAAGRVSLETHLAKSRGGSGQDNSAITFPSSGSLVTLDGVQTLTGKTIDANLNIITNLQYGSLDLTGTIRDADIAPTAAIQYSKLLLTGHITNSDIATSAGILYSKLQLSSSIVNADISPAAAVGYSKLQLSSSILGSDISNSAAIAGIKIVPDFGNQNIQTSGRLIIQGTFFSSFQLNPAQGSDIAYVLPGVAPVTGQVLTSSSAGDLSWVDVAGTGTVTSVALALPPSVFSVSGSPITTAGTLTGALTVQGPGQIFAGPATGSSATPTFRGLEITDLPALDTDDVTEGTGNLYYTDERAQDGVGAILLDTASVDLTYSDATPSISAVVLPAGVDHNALLNYSSNEHVDHTSVQIATSSTSGLSGGGTIAATRNLLIDPTRATTATPASGDVFLFADVSASNALRSGTLAQIQAFSRATATWITSDGTTKSVSHGLGTTDVAVEIYIIDTGETILVDIITRTDNNTVSLTASSAPTGSGWKIVIQS